jgi:hypothetical protein
MPVLAIPCAIFAPDEESDAGSGACPACGSNRLEFLAGYFESGATGPNSEPEVRCSAGV